MQPRRQITSIGELDGATYVQARAIPSKRLFEKWGGRVNDREQVAQCLIDPVLQLFFSPQIGVDPQSITEGFTACVRSAHIKIGFELFVLGRISVFVHAREKS